VSTKLRYLYRAYRYRFRVDRAELRFVRESLRAGQVAVDVGCHKGAYTYWMRRQVGPGGAVFAFEPQPRQVAYLRQVFATLPFDNVVLVPMALSDHVGQATLHVPSGAGRTHAASLERGAEGRGLEAGELPVAVTTLDAFFADQPRGPDFIKIDVEGHELAVLRGGRETIEQHRPMLLLECEARHRRDGDVRPVFELLEALGYQGTFFHNGGRRRLAEFDLAVHQHFARDSEKLPHGYVNNFAFLHSRQ
jgi:FkbM family methyltransferase